MTAGERGATAGRRSRVHAAAPGRRGTAHPRQEGPVDLRLIPPALAAWAAAALALGLPGTVSTAGVVVCTVSAGLLTAQAHRLRRGRPGARSPVLLTSTALTLLCAAGGAGVAALHAADLRRGPLPALAAQHASATVDLTVTGDPRRIRSRVQGAQQAPGAVLFRAEATRVTARGSPGPGASETAAHAVRTPVLVIVQQRDGPEPAEWLRMLPSTGLRTDARLMAPTHAGHGQDIAAVVRVGAEGLPPVVRKPSAVQRTAGSLRAGLREATDDLDGDARGLLPGLVVGDTTRLSAGLEEAFRTTDMTHLLAVSGANITPRDGLRLMCGLAWCVAWGDSHCAGMDYDMAVRALSRARP